MPLKLIRASAVALLALFVAPISHAQTVADFYRGKSVDLYIGTSVGGGYDAYGRMLARHIGKYLPGSPTIVPKNMEGGGGMRLANYLSNAAPKDGTAFAIFNRGTAFDPLLGNKSAQFDATKLNWIGSTNDEVSICATWHTTGVTTIAQAMTRELVVGATGPSGDTFQFPRITNGVLGTKFKIISGYPGGNDVDLAMERQEVQGRCGWSYTSVKSTRQAWLDRKWLNILLQLGLSKHPDLPDVPLIMDLAKTDEQRAIFKLMFARQVMAWPFVMPAGTPGERVEAMRKAFDETMADKDFLADASKAIMEIRPVAGAAIQKLVQEVYATPPAVAQKAIQLLQ
jgi:tripartite-type tricarboxylate transporter receptor subunit TctC